eukprot:1145285-Pelagomonas_calceolata.AAC.1
MTFGLGCMPWAWAWKAVPPWTDSDVGGELVGDRTEALRNIGGATPPGREPEEGGAQYLRARSLRWGGRGRVGGVRRKTRSRHGRRRCGGGPRGC